MRNAFLLPLVVLIGCATSASLPEAAPEHGTAAVSTADPLATRVGLEVLAAGGNAADAAVAVGFALAVVYPSAGNLGGGGFAISFDPATETATALDFRETAPAAATRDMYLDETGNVVPERSRFGHLAVGVPGSVAGMADLHARHGSLPWRELVAPAIVLARDGFVVSAPFADELNRNAEKLGRHATTARLFVKSDGAPWAAGERLALPTLAKTLERIAEHGAAGFYAGPVADALVAEMERGNGLITRADLADYSTQWRDVIRFPYRGRDVWSMPPPSSGGICLAMIAGVLARFPEGEVDLNTEDGVHRYVEAARRAYADRAEHLGDSDFHAVPREWLLSDAYAAARQKDIGPRATPSADVNAGTPGKPEGEETTHYSILDADGMAASVTTTLNFGYGSLVSVEGAGFLLNNEMDDFSAKPGVPNAYGLVGNAANAIAPGKRMLSSMSPTIVTRDGDVELVVGTPGGSTIITSVMQQLIRILDMQQSAVVACAAPRIHHQWLPDQIFYESERAPSDALLAGLRERGHALAPRAAIGNVATIHVADGVVRAVADPRWRGAAGTWTRGDDAIVIGGATDHAEESAKPSEASERTPVPLPPRADDGIADAKSAAPGDAPSLDAPSPYVVDCNANGVPDDEEIIADGSVWYGARKFIEYDAGNLPIVISVPHGGLVSPRDIPNRVGATHSRDVNTIQVGRAVAAALYARTGRRPHLILCQLRRDKLDANRKLDAAQDGHPEMERAWHEYHAFIDTAKRSIVRQFGGGLYIDIHGLVSARDKIELGYLLRKQDLYESDTQLDAARFIRKSSVRTLGEVSAAAKRRFSALIRGPKSLGGLLEANGFPTVPSPAHPDAGRRADGTPGPYFNGGYNTGRHGSRAGGPINGLQIELSWKGVRDSRAARAAFGAALAAALLTYIPEWTDIEIPARDR